MQRSSSGPPAAARALAEAADALAAPLIWLTFDGTLIHANATGLERLQRGRPLRREGQHIMPARSGAAAAFAQALAEAAEAEPGRRHALLPAMLGCRATLLTLAGPAGTAQPRRPLLLALATAGAGELLRPPRLQSGK